MIKEETFVEMMDRIQKKKQVKHTMNFKIMYCPRHLYETFVSDIHFYNDCFWAKLQDLIRKAECYDNIINMRNMDSMEVDEACEQIEQEVNDNQEHKEEPLTIGDLKELRKSKQLDDKKENKKNEDKKNG